MDLYVVTSPARPGRLKFFIAAGSEQEAIAEARRRGCGDDQVVARVWKGQPAVFQAGVCVACGYSLASLPTERGWATCPECGSRQVLP